jgi:hypothetical protein
MSARFRRVAVFCLLLAGSILIPVALYVAVMWCVAPAVTGDPSHGGLLWLVQPLFVGCLTLMAPLLIGSVFYLAKSCGKRSCPPEEAHGGGADAPSGRSGDSQ